MKIPVKNMVVTTQKVRQIFTPFIIDLLNNNCYGSANQVLALLNKVIEEEFEI